MIVVAGEALIDLVVTAEQIVATPGGAPYNVARGCARLGIETALMATLSADGFGQRLAAGLAESGVAMSLVQPTDRPTTLAVAEIDAGGGAKYRFYADGTSAPLLGPAALPDTVGALVTGGLGLVLEPMATVIEHVVAQASDDALVLVDLNCRPAAIDDRAACIARLRRVLARADVVKASEEDVDWLAAAGAELLRRRQGRARDGRGRRARRSGRRPVRWWLRSRPCPSSTRSAPATRSPPASCRGGWRAVAGATTSVTLPRSSGPSAPPTTSPRWSSAVAAPTPRAVRTSRPTGSDGQGAGRQGWPRSVHDG